MARRRLEKKSNLTLILMVVLVVAIAAFMLLYNPQPAKAQQQSQEARIEQTTLAKQGSMAPDFTVEMFDGQKVTLSALRGKVVLLNFWATWCPPCRAELARVQKDIIDRFEGQPFVFLPVSRGDSYDKVADFRAQMGYTFPMGLDTQQKVFYKYATQYIPRNFLIDREGRIVLASVGYDDAEFAALINKIQETINK
ncbi:MAG: TlpA family protein disulfide reductase [Alistipes sp.]|nr:TlpA family protein disulfide reductase [Alistipes sp.]